MRRSITRLAALAAVATMAVSAAAACAGPPPEALITETFTLGPFDLAPEGSPGGRASGYRELDRPEGAIAVKSIRWHVLDEGGDEVPNTDHRIHFHHVVAYSTKTTDAACRSGRQRFAAPGSERTALELPRGYGYVADEDDDWYANYDIMNQTAEPQPGIRVTYDVTYTRDLASQHDVTPYWFDLAGCGRGSFTVPGGGEPGSIWTRRGTFTLRQPGRILAVRGHMHAGGVDVTLTDAAGNVICKAVPQYEAVEPPPHEHDMDHDEHGMDHDEPAGPDEPDGGHGHGGPAITAIPLCKGLNVPVTAGQRVTVTVRYHNEEAQDEAMGSMLVYVAEDPPPPPTTTVPTTTVPPAVEEPDEPDGSSAARVA